MKAVLDEINGDVAVFVVDNLQKQFYKQTADLPADTEVGDVFEVKVLAADQFELGPKLPAERAHRQKSNQAKREQLLKRSRKK